MSPRRGMLPPSGPALPVAIAFLVGQRYVARGITMTGIK